MDANYGEEFTPKFIPANVGEFCGGYLATAEWIWSALQERMPRVRGWSYSAIKSAEADCRQFRNDNREDIGNFCLITFRDYSWAGHNFWLSRNGFTEVNFASRGAGSTGERLYSAARAFGPVIVELRDNWLFLTPNKRIN
jgi:hypothetical protein